MTLPFKFVLASTKDQWPFNKCEWDYSIPSTSTPESFSLSHRGMNLDGSCFPPAEHHILNTQSQLVGLTHSLPPLSTSQANGLDNPYHAGNQQRCMLTGSCPVRKKNRKKTSVPNFSHVTFSHSPQCGWV